MNAIRISISKISKFSLRRYIDAYCLGKVDIPTQCRVVISILDNLLYFGRMNFNLWKAARPGKLLGLW